LPEIQIILTSPIGITSIASISPLGITLEETWHKYLKDGHCLHQKKMGTALEWVASLSGEAESEIDRLRLSNPKYKELDSTVLYAIYASRKAVEAAGWTPGDDFGINIGSSRGATALFEKYHEEYISEHRTSTLSSPTTTL
jgi:3-oxoacyl-(acyl-carrier-protein) synthase